MDKIFKALSDSSRREILALLRTNDLTVGEIGAHFSFTAPTLSHHLDILKQARLVVVEREGKYLKYSLNTSVFEEALTMFMNIFEKKG